MTRIRTTVLIVVFGISKNLLGQSFFYFNILLTVMFLLNGDKALVNNRWCHPENVKVKFLHCDPKTGL